MFKILGADGKEYGPIGADQLKQWITEGRANQETMAQREGDTGWKRMGDYPEFAGAFTTPPPTATPQGGMPSGGAFAGANQKIPNYLVQSILVTLCCCLPGGIVAIIYAAQVNSKLGAGDIAGAQEASSKAKMWCWVSFGVGLVVNAIVIGVQVMAAMSAAAGAAGNGF